ncbi:L10-interacting MYB domain-containing protein [Linum perenne]
MRTVWTPEMDRYFIDLLLEQIKVGNNFDDHLYSKRAWNHMTSLFNAKFKFQYEKDVLKNRHKTLRNLYKSVRRLLDGGEGFSWDESRLMVTADNTVWEQHFKIHPESRSLRIRSIPYYGDLRLIYGGAEETAESTADEDCRNSGEETVNVSAVAGNRGRTYWQPSMDRYFMDLMMEQLRKGNQIDGVFRKQSWMEMIADFNSKFGFSYDVDVLKNRYKTLRRQYNVIKSLLELEGFRWDDHRQMVTADDSVWQDYIKIRTDARQYMTRPVPYYKDLCTICNGDDHQEEEHSTSAETEVTSVSEIGNKHRLEGQESCYPNKSTPSIERVVEAIQALPEMDEDLILDACDLLEDDFKATTFMALDARLRKKWLLRKLRS